MCCCCCVCFFLSFRKNNSQVHSHFGFMEVEKINNKRRARKLKCLQGFALAQSRLKTTKTTQLKIPIDDHLQLTTGLITNYYYC